MSGKCRDVSEILPLYIQKAIPFQQFNRMQSECLETWYSNENLFISAPTGAGKTVCFELAILRQVHTALEALQQKHFNSCGLQGKIVYIAPTKSLCSERLEAWKNKFSFLGIRTVLATGDSKAPIHDSTLLNADLILTTAEKWDSITRGIGSHRQTDISALVSLLLLDEVHQVGDPRGGSFEAVVTRMLVANRTSQLDGSRHGEAPPIAALRIIAVSATVSNVQDIGNWLGMSSSGIKLFDESYRPIHLAYHVLGYWAKNPWLYGKEYDKAMLDVLLKYGNGKPALVFCSSRKQTASSALALAKRLQTKSPASGESAAYRLTRSLSPEDKIRLSSCAKDCDDGLLKLLIPSGIAVHSADLSAKSRKLVEDLFRDSLIMCLFSTSTLAQGVNLPARLVVIAGTTVYYEGNLQEYDRTILLQMCGRAGRAGLDSKGVAVIMTARSNTSLYKNMRKILPRDLESRLTSKLEEVVNAEVARQVITDIPSAVLFLTNSFFWSCLRAKDDATRLKHSDKPENEVTSIAMNTVNKLLDMKLIQYDDDFFGVGSTSAGLAMAKYCISYATMKLLCAKIPGARTPSQVLRVVASCTELLDGVYVRRAEKRRLNELNAFVRMPLNGKVKDSCEKVFLLLQVGIGAGSELKTTDFSLRAETQRLLESASRVCACILDLVVQRAFPTLYESAIAVLQICRSVQKRCLWEGPTVLQQIPGISAKLAKLLAKGGVATISNLADLNPSRIGELLKTEVSLVKPIREKLRSFPKFEANVRFHVRNSDEPCVRTIDVQVSVSSQIAKAAKGGSRKWRNSSGFALVGSASYGVLLLEKFSLDEAHHHFTREVGSDIFQNDLTGSPIECIVGCDAYVGVDTVVHTEENLNHRVTNVKNGDGDINRRSVPVKRATSVTTSRISKKLKQSKLSRGESDSNPINMQCEAANKVNFRSGKTNPEIQELGKSQTLHKDPGSPRILYTQGTGIVKPSESEVVVPFAFKTATPCGRASTKAVACDNPIGNAAITLADMDTKPYKASSRSIARSESHVDPSPRSFQRDGSEYDNVFRSLF